VREARTKLSRLKKTIKFSRKLKKKKIVIKWKNIDNLKKNEMFFAKLIAKIFELLFDMSFKQF